MPGLNPKEAVVGEGEIHPTGEGDGPGKAGQQAILSRGHSFPFLRASSFEVRGKRAMLGGVGVGVGVSL